MSTKFTEPTVGLIVPPAQSIVPPESVIYPEIHFIAEGLGLESVEPNGYDKVIDSVIEKAQRLVERGAQAVSLMGTSLSFYRGNEKNDQLIQEMEAATGVPCSTMSHAIMRGLRAVGAKNIAVASSYIDTVNERLAIFLEKADFHVLSSTGLGETGVKTMSQITTETLVSLCLSSYEKSQHKAEAILLSCGGLRSLEAVKQVEALLDIPVIASSPAGFWDSVALINFHQPRQGFGKLIEV